MRVLRDGLWPSERWMLVARLSVAGLAALILAGCASENEARHVAGPIAHQGMAQAAKVELEADGAPVQPPPARHMRPEEDDPSQPWSPNYGNKGAAPAQGVTVNPRLPGPIGQIRQVDAMVTVPPAAAALQSASEPRSLGQLTQLSSTEADQIIAQAISAQEMREQ